jgi:branched-chain amino acid transport system permease protein
MVAVDWAAILLTLLLMQKSRLGRAWRASADDPLAASLCGIDPRRLLITTSALATALAGLAGVTITLNYGGMPFSGGTLIGITGLMAAILGGIGSLGGAVLGGVAIAAFQVGWSALREIANWELATFTLLSLALILKPGGFFGFADGAHRKV